MKSRTLTKTLFVAGIASIGATSQAAELRVNGFASIVGGKTISDEKLTAIGEAITGNSNSTYLANAIFANSGGTPNSSARYDDDISFKPETNIGLQISADLGQGLSITSQLTAHGANDFDAEVEWLYLSYDINNNLTLQGGRQRLPLYMYSDFLDVGYAYHWLRPPQEVYGAGISSYEGVSGRYSWSMGNWEASTRIYYGASDNEDSASGDIDFTDLYGLIFTTENDWLKIRASFHSSDVEIDGLDPSLNFSTGNEKSFDFFSLGGIANFGNLFITAEWTLLTLEEIFVTTAGDESGSDESDAWMISTGYRLGSWTPHITYAESTADYKSEDIDGNGITVDALGTDGKEAGTESWTLGVRYDFHPSASLKIEYIDSSDESSNVFQAFTGKTGEFSTFAVGVDLIF